MKGKGRAEEMLASCGGDSFRRDDHGQIEALYTELKADERARTLLERTEEGIRCLRDWRTRT